MQRLLLQELWMWMRWGRIRMSSGRQTTRNGTQMTRSGAPTQKTLGGSRAVARLVLAMCAEAIADGTCVDEDLCDEVR
ncbi:hypothetical protein DFH09DRAFT_1123080 [Mycena vulgaris]|nr:hypothetical protein DFH09DRAFT_1123080 [Mycena vulgaris]